MKKVGEQIDQTREKLDGIVPKYAALKDREQHMSAQ